MEHISISRRQLAELVAEVQAEHAAGLKSSRRPRSSKHRSQARTSLISDIALARIRERA